MGLFVIDPLRACLVGNPSVAPTVLEFFGFGLWLDAREEAVLCKWL